ncbi:DEAD/DEAH box helicase [Alicyclobacillaceae bacterium I2511]|nr:DEAD/DEAH box helicase [Alicyclobacillaceae bacterium I2511]
MKIQFDKQQRHQLDAISAVVKLFDGPSNDADLFEPDRDAGVAAFMPELGFRNYLGIDEQTIASNVQRIQHQNDIAPTTSNKGMDFSIEMETGTGKTYVYLRTIHELHAKYGFTKFIIVVPTVAIREGVLKNLQITREHFEELYGRQPLDYWVYDSQRVSTLRQFAISNQLQILVINMDSFNKKANNVIHRENDKMAGHKPIEFIHNTRPIVILDEPQNMETDIQKAAIASLKPLCTLRYSATHRHVYNLLYRLGPVKAYAMKLVKRIEVDSVLDHPDFNRPFIRVQSIISTKSKITAWLTLDVQAANGPTRKTVPICHNGVDLFEVSNLREIYRGYIVASVEADKRQVLFSNGLVLQEGQATGDHQEDVMKLQIYETVREHLEKELQVLQELPEGRRLKVLSLFFIDKVVNYADSNGKIRKWFVQAYADLSRKNRYAVLELPAVERVHNGYFATDKKGCAKDTPGNTKADDVTYELIMRDKERLLSRDEPLRFIFSHSALREGWDNPNVFQICTLNETKSEMKKRQEIGRGLRLPVDETGVRLQNHPINCLTVIANESYHDFVQSLQIEIEQNRSEKFPLPENKWVHGDEHPTGHRRGNGYSMKTWNHTRNPFVYLTEVDTSVLISWAAAAIHAMPTVCVPHITVERQRVDFTEQGVLMHKLGVHQAERASYSQVPDIIDYISRQTELTRGTLVEILINSDRLDDVFVNPQQFLDFAVRAIRDTLQQLHIGKFGVEST